jgi:Type I restriction modification DNA specificity domain
MEKQLKDREWKEFVLDNIFEIYSTSSGIDRNKLISKKGEVPYITRSEKENGYDSFICNQSDNYKIDKSNVITIGLDTQTVFYQPYAFYTGQNIQILENPNLNKHNASFFIRLLKVQLKKFSWGGNGATLTRLKRSKILLPTTPDGQPDYIFMEEFMRDKEQEQINTFKNQITSRLNELKNYGEVEPLCEKEWKDFFVDDISEIISGRDIYETERVKGNVPYITATANNNGIGYLVGNNNLTLEANCLSVNRNGSVGYAFYHPYPALFSNDCRKLRLNNPSKFIGIFISHQITKQKEKYGYGYKMGTARLKRQKIMLPIDTNGQPDYEYMEQYIKKIEYQKLMAFLEMKNVSV